MREEEGKDCMRSSSPVERGFARAGDTTDSAASLSRGCLEDVGTSEVVEAGQEEPVEC